MGAIEQQMKGKSAEELRAMAGEREQAAADSFERCDTDGFLSQWASGITAQQLRAQAKIAENGGSALFAFDSLVKLDGSETGGRLVQTKFGEKWRIDATDEWIGAKSAAGLARRGYKIATKTERAAAKAIIEGSGTGLAGAASCYVRVVRADGKGRGWYAVREES